MKNQKGFTLIELVIVIILLGILAAFAIPKYMTLDTNARISVVNGMQGALRSASSLVRVVAKVKGVNASNVVFIDNTTTPAAQVNVNSTTYYPLAYNNIGIVEALETYTGFTATGNNPVTFSVNGAPTPASCAVTYGLDTTPPNIAVVTTGC